MLPVVHAGLLQNSTRRPELENVPILRIDLEGLANEPVGCSMLAKVEAGFRQVSVQLLKHHGIGGTRDGHLGELYECFGVLSNIQIKQPELPVCVDEPHINDQSVRRRRLAIRQDLYELLIGSPAGWSKGVYSEKGPGVLIQEEGVVGLVGQCLTERLNSIQVTSLVVELTSDPE